jgi:hypothetical protein
MATVRITGNTLSNIHKVQWLGTPPIDPFNHIDRSIDLPEAIYRRMEEAIARGFIEGTIALDDGRRIDWFLDRSPRPAKPSGGTTPVGGGEGI